MKAKTARHLDELVTLHGWREAFRLVSQAKGDSPDEAIDALWGVLDAERKLAAAREAAGVSE